MKSSVSGSSKSRQSDFLCPAKGCSYVGRSDNVMTNLKQQAKFDKDGNPIEDIKNQAKRNKHTDYYLENKLTLSSKSL